MSTAKPEKVRVHTLLDVQTLDETIVTVEPTQVRRPWRTTVRSVFQGLLALAVMAPLLVQTAGLDPAKVPYLAGFLVVTAAFTRIMALPQVETFLRTYLSFLAAGGSNPR